MSRQPVRLITMAWGQRYIEELFSLTLPAILAPNNLPALAKDFECELVIVTEQAWFERLRQRPIYARLGQYCSVEFRPIDDLINRPDAYGMSLTYALFRGFEELGPAMVDRHLIFFNADFVLADGSLRKIGEKILAGERLILAPSYCVVGETVTPWLEARVDRERGYLSVPPREMACIALRNRHNTIRGKTVNQRAFSVEWMDQFYWLVDEQTLIGHQLPIAVVAMRPERVLTDMCTYWDYGIISEACPTTPPCVIADSDDFLMIELRSADTARDQLSLGWPEPKEIAGKLKQFITKDPISLARHTLVLHSGDLPPELDDARATLDRFVEAVLVELPAEPTHWVNHPNWAYHYPRFHAAREAFLGRRAPLTSISSAEQAVAKGIWSWETIARRVYYRYFGQAPSLRRLQPYWCDVQPVMKALARNPGGPALVVSSSDLPLRLFRNLAARHMTVSALGLPVEIDLPPTLEPERALSSTLCIEADRLGRVRSFELVQEETCDTDEAASASQPIHLPSPIRPSPSEEYGLCVLELNAADLGRLPVILKRVATRMRSGGRILVFHFNRGQPETTQILIRQDGLWLDVPCTIQFAGSRASKKAIEHFEQAIAGLRTRRLAEGAMSLLRLAGACFAAWRASRSDPAHSGRDPALFTSLTLEIEIPVGSRPVATAPDAARAVA